MSFIGKILSFTFSHAAQPDRPNGNFANSAAFKAGLDSQAIQLQTSVNTLYDALNSTTALSSGSENIGAAPIAGVAGNTPAAQIADLKAQFNALIIGQIPSDFISYGMARQAAINGDPQVWQAGTSFTNPANNTYTADMYVTQFNLDGGVAPVTLTHSQNTLTAGEFANVKYSYQLATTGAGSGFGVNASYGVFQRIEFGTSELCGAGRTVTISLLLKTSITNKRIAVGLKQTYGTGGSPSATEVLTPTASTVTVLTANLTKYSYIFTTNTLVGKTFGSNNNDHLEVGIYEMWGVTTATNNFGGGSAENFGLAGNINFTGLLVNTGSTALQFQPKSFGDEWLACMRYYEKSYAYGTAPATASTITGIESKYLTGSITNNAIYGKTSFKVKKRIAPTVTIYPYTTPSNTGRVSEGNNGADFGASTGSTYYAADDGFAVTNSSGAAITVVNGVLYHFAADARL